MKCCICGRELRNNHSRELGYGPICYRRVFGNCRIEQKRKNLLPEKEKVICGIPGQVSIDDYLQESLK